MRDLRDSAHGGTGIGVESGVGTRYGHSPLLVSVGWVCL